MKTIIINASPRKNWNTAQLLQEAKKGAEAAGAETEYIDLYDLNFTGCRSCLACKRKGAEKSKCYWKDDLSPLIDRIFQADAVIIGSPIYMGEPTAHFRALFERLVFSTLSYDDYRVYFEGKVNVGIIYTMNASKEYYDGSMRPVLQNTEASLGRALRGQLLVYPSFNTLQVSDYSKYCMGSFDEAEKKARRETQFPLDMQACYELGKELSR